MREVSFLASPQVAMVVGVIAPILFIVGAAQLKKLIRGPGGWRREDFYQGVELCWASLGAAILQYYDTARAVALRSTTGSQALAQSSVNTLLVLAALCLMFIVASWHQENASPQTARARKRQLWLLGIASNAIGAGLIFAFVVLVKGAV